ncbi:bifunctional serine/threonine-protein kinase/formylglycine-generating enzyme family protein [Thalassotalea crassostreae]|uniref:bifunctional serine/threonine-protein kinase/formylglycine-generating enzyme family protein n=1 Tax=Thalassotalea crassostreae TaxID=1763536 RepID=UPI0009EE6B1C|nr:bifunctional serine/threonine-protein kinase/formylglycine-generating enzyme family protein [Thalassotalea crassostreae]
MQQEAALTALGLQAEANQQDIEQAYQQKKAELENKIANAQTPALAEKFEVALQKLTLVYQSLQEQPQKSTNTANSPQDNSPLSQNPLSQTKIADLPGMAGVDTTQIELQPGHIIANRYEIKELIGQGGMGVVYRAFDKNRDADIAIKMLLPQLTKNESAKQRFLEEARLSSQLSHPNIVNVFDVQIDNDLCFLTMELLEGQELRAYLTNLNTLKQDMPIDEAKRIISELLTALEHAHQTTVHRDIKPENIWLMPNGQIKLMDFGIARLMSTTQRTQTGAATGTAYYMAPEQLQGKDVDARADLYAVGVLLYEMLTGQIPMGRFASAIEHRKEIGKGLSSVIDQVLEVNPEQRFASASLLNQAIAQGKQGKAKKRQKANHQLTQQGPNKGVIAAVILLFVIGLGFAGVNGHLDFLKPIDKELIAQQKGEIAKLQGEIKTYKKRLDNAERNLKSEVKDAQRSGASNLKHLEHWYRITQDYLFLSSLTTELEGELSQAELLLREGAANSLALAKDSFVKVNDGYKKMWKEFSAAEDTLSSNEKSEQIKSNWLATKKRLQIAKANEATQAEKLLSDAKSLERQGEFADALTTHSEGQALYLKAIDLASNYDEAKNNSTKAKSAWLKHQKTYKLTAPQEIAEANASEKNALNEAQAGKLLIAKQEWIKAHDLFIKAKGCCQDQIASVKAKWQKAADEKSARDKTAREKATKEKIAREKATKEKIAREKAAREKASIAKLKASIKDQLIAIPVGNFQMGSNSGNRSEKPVHRVSINAFYMQAHEVTWNQYQPCIDAGVCANVSDAGWGKGNRPMIHVSWNDIQNYINWLNKQGVGTFRLPSEAEWEYAARAGTSTKYSWGDSVGNNRANCGGCGSQWDDIKTAPVKSFSANGFGLYDMHGNVWEWVQDCYNDGYHGAPSNGSAWQSGSCDRRVVRGGSWLDFPLHLRSATRHRFTADGRGNILGFRLVQDL